MTNVLPAPAQFNSAMNSSTSVNFNESPTSSPWGPSLSSSATAFATSISSSSISSLSSRSGTGSNNFNNNNNKSSLFDTSSTSNLDFTEDPFKNYRYEDPFALADPFQSLAGDPFSQPQQPFQSNSHVVSSQLHGSKSVSNSNNKNNKANNNNINNNKNAHKNGFK